tara:strand:- start:299 stop:412 length:114 start_codon:yes stop_codon:yes gene_type:complete
MEGLVVVVVVLLDQEIHLLYHLLKVMVVEQVHLILLQ